MFTSFFFIISFSCSQNLCTNIIMRDSCMFNKCKIMAVCDGEQKVRATEEYFQRNAIPE